MNLRELQKNWNRWGEIDPLWAILTEPRKRHRKWDRSEFFKTGEEEISHMMQYIDSLKKNVGRRRALDFGCGVGRATQPLCRYFEECWGVDIAPSMIKLARRYNQYGERCRYVLIQSNDLRLFEEKTFDFVYSTLVLQHMRPEYSQNYIREFIRILAPGGLIVFQLPSELTAKNQCIHPYALPDSAFRAQITVASPSGSLRVNSQMTIPVKVKNLSEVSWPAWGIVDGKYRVNLRSRWLDKRGGVVADDGRVVLPRDLRPGEEVELLVGLTAPEKPGSYILELDMVQEHVAWFKHKGSRATTIAMHVLPEGFVVRLQRIWRGAITEGIEPRIEMYGVQKEVIMELVRADGAEIVDIREDHSAGPEWLSFRYYIRKFQ